MTSLIEQAAQRLEQLRQAGVAAPVRPTNASGGEAAIVESFSPERVALPNAGEGAAASATAFVRHAKVAASPALETLATAFPHAPAAPPTHSQHIEFDLDLLARSNLVTPNASRSQVADEFRVIKRPLITNAKGFGAIKPAHANLIMVTSSVAGEGKSFTSVNLAMSIAAELDATVMLVDADLARPSLPRMVGVAEGPGLLDLLDGSAQMHDVLLRTNVDKLTFLRSGTPHARATELLASEAMRRLVADMSQRYADRIIIFDSPPLLLTTEARALAMNMGQIVFVVRAGKTLQSVVQHALSTIEACPLKMMLLNQTRAGKQGVHGEYGLGYGYAYGYGYGYGGAAKKNGA